MAKTILSYSPTFDPALKTLDFSGYSGFSPKYLYAVLNTTRGVLIYAAGSSGLGYSAFSSNVLTLSYDTSTHSSGDVLSVIYETNPTALPAQTDAYQAVRPLPLQSFRSTFSKVIASGVDTDSFTVIATGAGQSVSQSAGNLVMTSGTTANAETIIRSAQSFTGALVARWSSVLSQRIVNNNFAVELVDVIGDGLALTVNSATSVTVTIPSNTFTSQNVGQSIHIGAVSGVAAAVPGRYAISSVAGNAVTFTVAGWPASGTGTCSLYGWNYLQAIYTGTTVTSMNFDGQRKGWASGATAATINTTASPGHVGIIQSEDSVVALLDQLSASNAALQTTMRASRIQSVPGSDVTLYLQFRVLNGTAAPATTTSWTVGFATVENYAPQSVSIHSVKPSSFNAALPVQVLNATTVTGTLSGVTSVSSANLALPSVIVDITSAAITSSATSSTVAPTAGIAQSYNIIVTAVAGTAPTLDVGIDESDDNGTSWFRIYDFPRITATGQYRTPSIRLTGNRVRYVQTVTGTTPSFTRSMNRLQSSNPGTMMRQIIDRTINPNTLNSTSTVMYSEGLQDFNMIVRCTAQTTPATIRLQASEDSSNWFDVTTADLTTVVGVARVAVPALQARFIRAVVSTAGSGITMGELTIKGLDL